MTDKEKIKELIEILEVLKEDAEMAINGDWDKSNEGFQDQIDLIDNTLKLVK